jgi:predicted nucleic-acid-binding Zn-ribbon protein
MATDQIMTSPIFHQGCIDQQRQECGYAEFYYDEHSGAITTFDVS